jgi:hypothetical protein
LKRPAPLRNRKVVFDNGAATAIGSLNVVDLQPMQFHPVDLVAGGFIDFAAEESHRHTAFATLEAKLRLALR